MKKAILYTDGGTRGGNPGVSACGFVIIEHGDESGDVVVEGATLLGCEVSNNEAEYGGLIYGLYNCAAHGYTHVHVFTDSQIMANQMNGLYGVKAPNLQDCYAEAKIEEQRFEHVTYEWISRKNNSRSDRLVRDLLDEEMAIRKDYRRE